MLPECTWMHLIVTTACRHHRYICAHLLKKAAGKLQLHCKPVHTWFISFSKHESAFMNQWYKTAWQLKVDFAYACYTAEFASLPSVKHSLGIQHTYCTAHVGLATTAAVARVEQNNLT